MGTVITNLKARFGVDAGDFKKGMSEVDKTLADFDSKVETTVRGLGKMLTPLALLGGAGGAIAFLKQSLESVEGPGDRFEAIIGGGKEALFEFQRALGSMDFSNFFTNLDESFERGKRFTEALDDLADRTAYNDYKIAELHRDSEALREITKDKTKELKVRADAAEKVKEIEEKIVKRKIELAKEEFEIVRGQWESRNKMEADEAIRIYELIDNMAPELKERLQKAFEGATEYQLGSVKKGIKSVLLGVYDPELIKEVDKDTLESYGQFFKLIETGERDVMIKLFNTFKDIEEEGYQAQKEYNTVVAETTRLLAAENKQQKDKLVTLQKIARVPGIESVSTGNLSIGTTTKTQIAGTNNPVVQQIELLKAYRVEIDNVNKTIEQAIETAVTGFGMWVGEFAVGVNGFRDLRQMVGNTFGDMLIELGKVAIKTGIGIEAIKNAFAMMSGVTAIAIGISLVAFGSAIKSQIQKVNDERAAAAGQTTNSNEYIYDTRGVASTKTEYLKIGGTVKLVAEGRDLVGVLTEENIRLGITT